MTTPVAWLMAVAMWLSVLPSALGAQGGSGASATASPVEAAADVTRAMVGHWVGTLEYRDYSEPAESTRRVKLPTWLTVEAAPDGALRYTYVYDDGPAKVVTDSELVRVDGAAGTYKTSDATGKAEDILRVSGLDALKQGRGVLTLTGKGTENSVQVDVRVIVRVGRNILEMTRDSGAPLAFRHAYTFVRAERPVAASSAER